MSATAQPASTSRLTTHSSASQRHQDMRTYARGLLPGLILTGAIALVSIQLGKVGWLQSNGLGALTLAIVLGMAVGNTVYSRVGARTGTGVHFSKVRLLRLGIVLYGLRLTFQDIGNVGWAGVAIDAAVLTSTFGVAYLVGTKVLGVERGTALLIGAGSSICGAAAVLATEPVVRGRAEQVMVAVSTVVVFGTLAMFLYPALYHLNARYQLVHLSPAAYGLFAGSTIHEVAQVVAGARAISEQAADTAVIAKMVRVMMLAPFLLVLSAWLSRSSDHQEARGQGGGPARGRRRRTLVMPWFALGFVAVAALNSLSLLPRAVVERVIDIDTALLAMAMAGLGLTTHVSAIRQAGIRPLALAAVLFAWLICGGLAINLGVAALVH